MRRVGRAIISAAPAVYRRCDEPAWPASSPFRSSYPRPTRRIPAPLAPSRPGSWRRFAGRRLRRRVTRPWRPAGASGRTPRPRSSPPRGSGARARGGRRGSGTPGPGRRSQPPFPPPPRLPSPRRRVVAGHVTCQAPRSRFITAAIPANNFGVQAIAQFGALELRGIYAQQKGNVVTDRVYTIGDVTTQPIDLEARDLDYEAGRFFFAVDPPPSPRHPPVDIPSPHAPPLP